MTKINNKAALSNDEQVNNLRKAYEHRAIWMGLILDEAEKAGLDWENVARKAINRCGFFHGGQIAELMENEENLNEFSERFLSEMSRKIFEVDVKELTDDTFAVEFNYCPLVSGWLKQEFNDEKIEKLCDIAMDGDRGIGECFKNFEFQLGKTIAQGHSVCEVSFHKKP